MTVPDVADRPRAPAPQRLRARSGVREALAALAWLYLYCVVWLTAYTVLAVLAFGWTPIVITGGSMEPLISKGDVVVVGGTDELLGNGTVVTFRPPGQDRLVTHRVVGVQPDGYRTRGDANAVADSDVVAPEAVVGAGRLLVPLLGRPLVWARSGDAVPLVAWLLGTAAALAVVSRRASDQEGDPSEGAASVGGRAAVEEVAEPRPGPRRWSPVTPVVGATRA